MCAGLVPSVRVAAGVLVDVRCCYLVGAVQKLPLGLDALQSARMSAEIGVGLVLRGA